MNLSSFASKLAKKGVHGYSFVQVITTVMLGCLEWSYSKQKDSRSPKRYIQKHCVSGRQMRDVSDGT